jgi:hypothetical protein
VTLAQIQALVKYVTNQDGETTDVLMPMPVWETLVALLASEEAWQVDEMRQNPKKILADL